MSEETKTTTTTTTEETKTPLWASVPWGVQDKQTKQIQLTGNVEPTYLSVVLAQQLQLLEQENVELKKKVKDLTPDTSVSDI